VEILTRAFYGGTRMETFDRRQTSWEGLWWHPELQCFTSASINLAKLKKFKGAVRITVKKNRWFSGGLNGRPNYVFCIRDSKAESEKEIESVSRRGGMV
jgi:hypothetical protein